MNLCRQCEIGSDGAARRKHKQKKNLFSVINMHMDSNYVRVTCDDEQKEKKINALALW